MSRAEDVSYRTQLLDEETHMSETCSSLERNKEVILGQVPDCTIVTNTYASGKYDAVAVYRKVLLDPANCRRRSYSGTYTILPGDIVSSRIARLPVCCLPPYRADAGFPGLRLGLQSPGCLFWLVAALELNERQGGRSPREPIRSIGLGCLEQRIRITTG